MNNKPDLEARLYEAMDELREAFPAVQDYQDFEIEQLVEIMRVPVRSVGSCISKEQLKTLCIQLLTQNLTLQAEVKRLKSEVKTS